MCSAAGVDFVVSFFLGGGLQVLWCANSDLPAKNVRVLRQAERLSQDLEASEERLSDARAAAKVNCQSMSP